MGGFLMKRKDLIKELEKLKTMNINDGNERFSGRLILTRFIEKLKEDELNKPNGLAMVSNGECEHDGVYAPQKDGEIDFRKAKPFKEGDSFPDDGDWVQVGSAY